MENSLENKVIVYPTDTVWGIGGNINSKEVYESISSIKKTKQDKPLSILFTDIDMLKKYFSFTDDFLKESIIPMASFETTFAIPVNFLKLELPKWCLFESLDVYIRFIPGLQIARDCKRFNAPVFSTSLNLSGENPILSEEDAMEFFNLHISNGKFYSIENEKMSGESSSILKLSADLKWEMIRAGSFKDLIMKKITAS